MLAKLKRWLWPDPLDRTHPYILLHGKPATYRQVEAYHAEMTELLHRLLEEYHGLAISIREMESLLHPRLY